MLEAKLSASPNNAKSVNNLINKAIDNLSRLYILYEQGTVKQKRQIVSSIYPEKLIFDKCQYRTPRLNEAVRLIYSLGENFIQTKNRKDGKNLLLSGLVALTGKLSNYIVEDLLRFSELPDCQLGISSENEIRK